MNILKAAAGIILAAAVLLTSAAGFLLYINTAPDDQTEGTFIIDEGASVAAIANLLEAQDFIRSALFFRLTARVLNTDENFKSGTYRVERQASMKQIHDMLVSGVQELYRVTIPEGYSKRRISSILEENGIVSSEQFLAAVENTALLEKLGIPGSSAEGFLFPETYLFQKNYPAKKVVAAMVDTFFNTLEDIYPDHTALSGQELLEKVVLASIVEREYRIDDEAPRIASVFYNRLKIRMPLESCATVVYVLTEELGKPHPDIITWADTEIESAFNTYENYGLPPAPIANPGRIALDAVFHPAETEYLFFRIVDSETGKHYFSRSFSEHTQIDYLYVKSK